MAAEGSSGAEAEDGVKMEDTFKVSLGNNRLNHLFLRFTQWATAPSPSKRPGFCLPLTFFSPTRASSKEGRIILWGVG